jgi:hypothetical protein
MVDGEERRLTRQEWELLIALWSRRGLVSRPSSRAHTLSLRQKDADFFIDMVVPNEWVCAITWREAGELVVRFGKSPH